MEADWQSGRNLRAGKGGSGVICLRINKLICDRGASDSASRRLISPLTVCSGRVFSAPVIVRTRDGVSNGETYSRGTSRKNQNKTE